nr:MAG TPA: hypothetical protein [Caudoviricetes sp.]
MSFCFPEFGIICKSISHSETNLNPIYLKKRADFSRAASGNGFFDDSGIVRSVANQSPDPTSIVGNGQCVWQSWLVRFVGRRYSWKIP